PCKETVFQYLVLIPGFYGALEGGTSPRDCSRCATIMMRLRFLMFVVVWQFEITEDKVAGFEAAYGPEGAWAQLFCTLTVHQPTKFPLFPYAPLSPPACQ